MKRKELNEKVDVRVLSTKEALELLFAEINRGQQKQIVKNAKIKELFDTYGVEYEE